MKMPRVLTLALLLGALPMCAQQIAISKDNKTIAISTSGQAEALADTAVVNIGFRIYGKDHDSTYAEALRTSNAIIKDLISAGLPKDAIQSNQQDLSELSQNGDDDKARFASGIRFQFSQSWSVNVPAAQAANVLHLAITSGANDSGAIQWQLKDEDALQAEAAAKALEHAREIATKMAKGLGANLGPLVYASNQSPPSGIFANLGFGNVQLDTSSASMSSRLAKNLAPLAISPERITRSATVYAVFSIQ
jgi:uncharacterized protein YggE